MKERWSVLLGALLLIALGCGTPQATPVRWQSEPPGISRENDRFTTKVLELDASGNPKSGAQWKAVATAVGQAQDVVLFIHGWRKDARDLDTMEAFLNIYRGAFECLAQRDMEGTQPCTAIHGYCHPASRTSKLVILLLWDGHSGIFGFQGIQRQAYGMGPGLLKVLEAIHQGVHERGTFIALGHSLGGTALASAIAHGAKAGHVPLDGAILVVSAFDSDQFSFRGEVSETTGGELGFLLNLYNRKDGYLRLYRWIYGGPTAGEIGLKGVPATPGDSWAQEGRQCGPTGSTSLGASLYAYGARVHFGTTGVLDILNMDATGLMRGHTNIEDPTTLRIYNRVAAEMLFQILWNRVPTTPISSADHPKGRPHPLG